MRVLHVTPAYAPNSGGIETILSYLLPQFAESEGYKVALLVGSPDIWQSEFNHFGAKRDVEGNVEVWRFGIFEGSSKDISAHVEIASAIRRIGTDFKPNVIHIHGPSRLANAVYRYGRSCNLPIVLHLHGSISESFSPSFIEMCREADAVLVPSRYVENSVIQVSARTKSTTLCSNAVSPAAHSIVKEYSRNTKRVSLVSAGRLEINKGFDTSIRVLKGLVLAGLESHLDIYGVGPAHHDLIELSKELQVQDFVKIKAPVLHHIFLQDLISYDYVIVPSRDFEGFGMVAAEASAVGVICVASAVGGLKEVIEDKKSGFLVAQDDSEAIVKVILNSLDDLAARDSMASFARDYALSEFSLKKMITTIGSVYSRVT
jgi:glycosyltransferase involved in cell wall biosynthesis